MKNTLRFGGKELAYTFRCRTRGEMLSWWETLDQLSRDTQTERETTVRVKEDPVGLAVSKVGYREENAQTEHVAGTVAHMPGEHVEELDQEQLEREEEEEHESDTASVATNTVDHVGEPRPVKTSMRGEQGSVVLGAPVVAHHEQQERERSEHQHEEEHDDDSEDGGGSSEEEYASDDEMAIARTAPSTPAPASGLHTAVDPMAEHSDRHFKAETLPAYVGEGTSVAEKQAVVTESKGAAPPALGQPVSVTSVSGSSVSEAPTGEVNEKERIEVTHTEAAPAALATTSAAS